MNQQARQGALTPYTNTPTKRELCGFHGWLDAADNLTDLAIAQIEAMKRRGLAQCIREAVELSDREIADLRRDFRDVGLTLYAMPISGRSIDRDVIIGSALAVGLPLGVTVTATAIPAWMAVGGLLVIVGGVLYVLHTYRTQ